MMNKEYTSFFKIKDTDGGNGTMMDIYSIRERAEEVLRLSGLNSMKVVEYVYDEDKLDKKGQTKVYRLNQSYVKEK